MNDTSLSVVIVNWNGLAFLPNCLRSIAENPPSVAYEVVIVDNASSDGSVEWLRSSEARQLVGDAEFRLIEPGENCGFGGANNLAFSVISSPMILLLNPDTVVRPRAIDQIISTLDAYPQAGGVAPKILNADGTVQTSVWGIGLTPLKIIFEELKLYHLLPKEMTSNWLLGSHWNYRKRQPVPVVSGAAILVRRDLITKVGGFDEDFHMYGEDLEWCTRIWKSGSKIYFEPDAEITHFGGESSALRWSETEKALVQEEAFLLFQKKTLNKGQFIGNSIAKAFVASVYLVKHLITRDQYRYFFQLFKMQLRNAKIALKG